MAQLYKDSPGKLPDISSIADYDKLEADDVREEYALYQNDASDFHSQVSEDWQFYLGSQLTQKQKDYLISVGQPPESNNKIRPAVEQVLANVAAASPEWHVIPVGKTDGEVAWVHSQVMERIWFDSYGDVQFRNAVKHYIIKGLTFVYVYPDWTAENGLGAIRMKHLPTESIFVDPNSALPDFSDAASIIYSDLDTKIHLKSQFPQYVDLIEDAMEDYNKNELSGDKYNRDYVITRGDVVDDGSQPKIRKFIRFAKLSIPKIRVTDEDTKFTQVFDRKQYDEMKKDSKFIEYVESGNVMVDTVYERHIRETCVFGDAVAYDHILPITDYPIIPACNEFTGNPYPSGDVRHAKSPQRMLNRTEALLIAHTNATANFKLVYEDGAIEQSELAKWHIPNAVVRVNPGALREGKIKEFAPPSVSSSLYNEKQRYEVDIEQVFGAYKFQQGNPDATPGTVGEASLIDEAVSRKQNWKILPIYDMLTRAARIAVEWMPHVYDQQRVLRLVNPQGDDQEVKLNLPVTDHTGGIKRMYDMVSAQVDIRVVVGSTKAKNPMADLQRDLGLMQAGIYDDIQVITNMQTGVDKGALIERRSMMAQLQQQVQGLGEELKKAKGDLQTREREIYHANMRAEIAEATKSVSQSVSNIKANEKLETARRRDTTRQFAQQVNSIQKNGPPTAKG